jgi:hypothetical protein
MGMQSLIRCPRVAPVVFGWGAGGIDGGLAQPELRHRRRLACFEDEKTLLSLKVVQQSILA